MAGFEHLLKSYDVGDLLKETAVTALRGAFEHLRPLDAEAAGELENSSNGWRTPE